MAGTKHDSGKSRMDLIDMETLLQMGNVLRDGAAVHGANNWRKGLAVSRLIAAALRHIVKFMMGQDIDPDHGTPHLVHAMVSLMFAYATVRDMGGEWDDRHNAPSVQPELPRLLIYSVSTTLDGGPEAKYRELLLERARASGVSRDDYGDANFEFHVDKGSNILTLQVFI